MHLDDLDQRNSIVLTVPGIGNSGPEHWQTRWELRNKAIVRVQQRDWDNPVLDEWLVPLEGAARSTGRRVILAAHSLGCLLVCNWLSRTSAKVCGALLVAVPDPKGPIFPAEAVGFGATPMVRLPCPSIVVASGDDPYGHISFSKRCAEAWGSRFISIGNAGHINAASGLGQWEEGQRLLAELAASA